MSGGQEKGYLEEPMRERIRGSIERIVEQELQEARAPRVRSGSESGASGIATDIAREP